MLEVQGFLNFLFAAIPLMLRVVAAAQAGDPLAAIQQQLSSQAQVTTTTTDRSDIVNAGSVFELHKDGVMMYTVAAPMPQSNTYKNGKISQGAGGFGKSLLFGLAEQGGGDSYPQRKFMAGEKCWVTGFTVQKDGVLFRLYSDPYNDVRYYGNLKIPFPNKKELPTVEAALQLVAEVLTVVPPDDQGDQNNQADQQPAPPPPPVQPARPVQQPHPVQMQRPSPPAAPARMSNPKVAAPAAPLTISVGQTRDQVLAAFGEPARKAVIGAKEIFVYKDMKVTLLNGKVSDVE
jgi:hypothetical protein